MDRNSVSIQRGDMNSFSENYLPEDTVTQRARARGDEIGTLNTTPIVGSLLRYLTHLIGATSVVEVGTGSGVSGLWIFKGLAKQGVLTSIDEEAENSKIARTAFEDGDINAAQYRLITGNTRDVISKLADSLYDLFVIRDFEDLLESVDQGFRALRPGGILLIDSALGGGKVADPTQRDPITISRRETIKSIKETDDRWEPMLLPLGEGVLVATKLN